MGGWIFSHILAIQVPFDNLSEFQKDCLNFKRFITKCLLLADVTEMPNYGLNSFCPLEHLENIYYLNAFSENKTISTLFCINGVSDRNTLFFPLVQDHKCIFWHFRNMS